MSRAKFIINRVALVIGLLFCIPSLLVAFLTLELLGQASPDGESGMTAFIMLFFSVPIATVFLALHLALSAEDTRKLGLQALAFLYGCPVICVVFYFVFRR
jgi:hypothetical protein